MKTELRSALRRISPRQWSGLGVAVGLGGLLVALFFAGLAPRAADAAGLNEPATAYPCSEPGLNAALAAGGSATFTCGAPTTVIVSARKSVTRDVTLAGGNNLILSGNNLTGVFTVAAGVHLTLLDLTVQDGLADNDYGGGIYNAGHLNVTHSRFVDNHAYTGSVVYNAPGASAVISASLFYYNGGSNGGLANGSPLTTTAPAALIVANSVFSYNNATFGAAIFNFNGPVTVTGSTFYQNLSFVGGAIYDLARLAVDQSQFISNSAEPFVVAARPQPQAPAGSPVLPAGLFLRGGGAIGIGDNGNVLIVNTAFTSNFALDTGGAIFFATLPMDSSALVQTGNLTILDSHFDDNCTAGLGGAVSTAFVATIRDSLFSQNRAVVEGAVASRKLISRRRTGRPSARRPRYFCRTMPALAAPSTMPGH